MRGITLANYLSAIQNWFAAGYYGRHLGLILREIGNRHPKLIASFISDACGIPAAQLKAARFETEHRFHGKFGPRIADLAVLVDEEATPRVLIEIKYYDKPLAETEIKPAQLDDYAAWQRRAPDRYVLMLSREFHHSNGIVVRRWGELARYLKAQAANPI
jgi:hypothetical protein